MREVIFDTETTGLDPQGGDRLVEIGCVEMVNRVETGRTFHAYFNPERSMPAAAEAVHGLSDAFLADKPLFASRVAELLEFLGTSPMVAHNAGFDFGFLDAEMRLCGLELIPRSRMIDTVAMARVRHPGAKNSLDALCTRYGIDRSHRTKHGALLDAELLAQVYVELTGGRQNWPQRQAFQWNRAVQLRPAPAPFARRVRMAPAQPNSPHTPNFLRASNNPYGEGSSPHSGQRNCNYGYPHLGPPDGYRRGLAGARIRPAHGRCR
jgi:DNA polymerase-3 subunit epsilon